MVKKLVCIVLCLLSNLLVLSLCLRVLNFSNPFTALILVMAPMVFTLPWVVIMRKDK